MSREIEAFRGVLGALAFTRDESRREWDALMSTKAGPVLMAAWDVVRAYSQESPPVAILEKAQGVWKQCGVKIRE